MFRWKLQKTICGFERMVDYIKNCVQQHVKFRLAFIVRRIHLVQMHHMWVIRLLIDGDHFQRLAGIVCDCDRRWVQIKFVEKKNKKLCHEYPQIYSSKLTKKTFTRIFFKLILCDNILAITLFLQFYAAIFWIFFFHLWIINHHFCQIFSFIASFTFYIMCGYNI